MSTVRFDLFFSPDHSKLLIVGTMATISGLIYGAWWYNNYMKNKMPTSWVKVGEISELAIYPMKSFKGIRPNSFECTPCGPRLGTMRDRTFVVLDENGKMVSGRIYPRLSVIVPKFTGTIVSLSSPDSPTEVEFSLTNLGTELRKFEIWTVPVEGWDCGNNVAKWLSQCILKEDSGLRLYYCANQEKAKMVNPKISQVVGITKVRLEENDGGFFSDAVAYHLISDASTQHLNTRSNDVISSLNFRPNFVVKGDKLIPFEEDNWEWIKIGDAIFKNISLCTRCIFTTVNPATGERSKTLEPLTSMKRYRNLRDPRKRKALPGPAMGIYLGLRSPAKVFVGDSVYVPEF